MNVLVEENSLQAIADAIREKNGSKDTYKPSEMGNAVRAIQSGGESEFGESYWIENFNGLTSYSHRFSSWKSEKIPFIDTAKATTFQNTFANSNIVEIPNLDFSNAKDCYAMFNSAKKIKDIVLNFPKVTRLDYGFSGCTNLENVEFESCGTITNWSYTFNSCSKLKSIKGLDLSSATSINGIFNNSNNIETILFVPNTIKLSMMFKGQSLLTAESIQSIIDGLADLTGGTAQTITFHADVKAKLTETQISQITSKNWTLA